MGRNLDNAVRKCSVSILRGDFKDELRICKDLICTKDCPSTVASLATVSLLACVWDPCGVCIRKAEVEGPWTQDCTGSRARETKEGAEERVTLWGWEDSHGVSDSGTELWALPTCALAKAVCQPSRLHPSGSHSCLERPVRVPGEDTQTHEAFPTTCWFRSQLCPFPAE